MSVFIPTLGSESGLWQPVIFNPAHNAPCDITTPAQWQFLLAWGG